MIGGVIRWVFRRAFCIYLRARFDYIEVGVTYWLVYDGSKRKCNNSDCHRVSKLKFFSLPMLYHLDLYEAYRSSIPRYSKMIQGHPTRTKTKDSPCIVLGNYLSSSLATILQDTPCLQP